MTFFSKNIFAWITRDNPQQLSKFPGPSQKKVATLGSLVLIPTMLWFFTAWLTMWQLLDLALYQSLAGGLAFAFFIFIIDRAIIIIMAKKKWFSSSFRIILALTLACFGSMTFDTLLFQQDINNYQIKNEANNMQKKVDAAERKVNDLQLAYFAEMNGNTGHYGRGPVAKAKELEMNKAELERDVLKNKLTELNEALEGENNYQMGKGTLLLKIQDLHKLYTENKLAKFYYWLLFAMVALFEMLPLIMKLTWKETAWEYSNNESEKNYKKHIERMSQTHSERMALKEAELRIEKTSAAMRKII